MSDHERLHPLLAARPGELDPTEAGLLGEHVARCASCAAEVAGYTRLAAGLRVLRELELVPPEELLDTLLALTPRRRPSRRVIAAAAGSLGAVAATVAVAGVIRSRRRVTRSPVVPVPARPRARGLARLARPPAGRAPVVRPAFGRLAPARPLSARAR
jgi:hypothetical protein